MANERPTKTTISHKGINNGYDIEYYYASDADEYIDALAAELAELREDIARLRKGAGFKHVSVCIECENLTADNQRLREALEHYANRKMWRQEVFDSLSGELDVFDWDGDLADEPWEIAQAALAATAKTEDTDNERD